MKKDRFILFLTALVPGVGYMYLGLIKKGIEALVTFLLIKPIFEIIGLGFLGQLLMIALVAYTFFDTYKISGKMDSGFVVEDEDFFSFDKVKNVNSKKTLMILAWILIAIGAISFLNIAFGTSVIFVLIKDYIRKFSLPVVLIFIGIYLLFKNKF